MKRRVYVAMNHHERLACDTCGYRVVDMGRYVTPVTLLTTPRGGGEAPNDTHDVHVCAECVEQIFRPLTQDPFGILPPPVVSGAEPSPESRRNTTVGEPIRVAPRP